MTIRPVFDNDDAWGLAGRMTWMRAWDLHGVVMPVVLLCLGYGLGPFLEFGLFSRL